MDWTWVTSDLRSTSATKRAPIIKSSEDPYETIDAVSAEPGGSQPTLDGRPPPHDPVRTEGAATQVGPAAGQTTDEQSIGAGETVDAPRGVASTDNARDVGSIETTTPQTARAPRFLGEYEILSEIARGGMGVVYRARQVKPGRVVALKLVWDPSWATFADLRRFQIEAEAVAQLDHPNIVPIFEVGQTDDQPSFSMKLIEGGNLARDVERLKGDPRYVARLMVKVARAVSYAHQHAILHRDLKPSNILLDGHDEPYVTDFALAKRMEPGEQDTAPTLTGAVMGTPAYMPPEQAGGGTKSLTTAADVYSLGATLYETLTGQPPFAGDSAAAILRQVIDKDPALHGPGRCARSSTSTSKRSA